MTTPDAAPATVPFKFWISLVIVKSGLIPDGFIIKASADRKLVEMVTKKMADRWKERALWYGILEQEVQIDPRELEQFEEPDHA